ncbi:hypothetical protein LINPERPRIM_LOCUS38912, partial [Linum perenne]
SYFHPIQATEPISKSTDSIYRWIGLRGFAGISWTSNGPPEFLKACRSSGS